MKLTPEMREDIVDASVDGVMDYMNKTKEYYKIGTIIGHVLIKFCRIGTAVANNVELMDEIAESTKRIVNKLLDETELLTDLAKKDDEFAEGYVDLYEYIESLDQED